MRKPFRQFKDYGEIGTEEQILIRARELAVEARANVDPDLCAARELAAQTLERTNSIFVTESNVAIEPPSKAAAGIRAGEFDGHYAVVDRLAAIKVGRQLERGE
jgi:hypothetical protein